MLSRGGLVSTESSTSFSSGGESATTNDIGEQLRKDGSAQAALWAQIREQIKERLGHQRFGLWFKHSCLLEMDEGSLTVGVRNVLVKQYLEHSYRDVVCEAAAELLGVSVSVKFDVAPRLFRRSRAEGAEEEAQQTLQEHAAVAAPAVAEPQAGGTALEADPLDQLVVTPKNELPLMAARQIACEGKPPFHSLLLLGDHGMGKTTLLRAVRESALRAGTVRLAEYSLAEAWCNGYYHALQSNSTRAFRRRYRHCDMLLLDGVQFLQGKPAAQDELVYTAKHLVAAGGRLVLSSTVHPDDMEETKPAFTSLLKGAFWVQLVMPELPEREHLVRRLAEVRRLDATDQVHLHIARHHASSVQELDATICAIATCACLEGPGKVDLPRARRALSATARCRRRQPNVQDIQKAVSEVFAVAPQQLTGASRHRRLVHARQVGMYLCRQLTGESLADIGRAFGGRTHSTVKHAVDKIEARIGSGDEVDRRVSQCMCLLGVRG